MIDKTVNYSWNNENADFFQLVGQTIIEVVKINESDFLLSTWEGNLYALYHSQNCCEHVRLKSLIGEFGDVIGTPITLAESVHTEADPPWYKLPQWGRDSYTWSKFILETTNGRLELWFLGESNGYYGESVDFVKVKTP